MSMDFIHKVAFALTIIKTVANSAANIQKGTTYSDTYRNADVIIAYDKMGLKMCGRRCIYQDQCDGINYNPTTLVCELLKAGGTSEVSTDYIYSPINTWTMDSDTCHTNQCDNTRKCVKTKSNGHACVKISTPCDGVVCENGGTCKNGVTSFTCQCDVGYIGTHCKTPVCDSSLCANGGTCSISETSWSCQCSPGFTGTSCQIAEIASCLQTPSVFGANISTPLNPMAGTTVQYSCAAGFEATSGGNGSITCLGNGTWSAPSTLCNKCSIYSSNYEKRPGKYFYPPMSFYPTTRGSSIDASSCQSACLSRTDFVCVATYSKPTYCLFVEFRVEENIPLYGPFYNDNNEYDEYVRLCE